jgi:hypothetical protein
VRSPPSRPTETGAVAFLHDKLQRAGRDFLMRLVARHGLAGAARVLRALADELDRLAAVGAGPWMSA